MRPDWRKMWNTLTLPDYSSRFGRIITPPIQMLDKPTP
jgi:hypothetical protein